MAEETPKPILDEIAAMGGDDIGAEFVGELRSPSDRVLRSRGGGNVALYEQVLQDPQAKSCFRQLRSAIISREWQVEAGGESALDQLAAEDLKEQLSKLAFDDVTRKMLTGVWYSYSVGELMLRADGTRIVLDGVKVRKAKRFRFDRDNRLRLIRRSDQTSGTVMPEGKFWVFRCATEDDDDPYGLGLGHDVYWPVWFKRNVWRFWATFVERFANPTPIAKIPPGAKENDRLKLLKLLTNIVSGGKIVIPNNIALELLQALRSSGGDYEKFSRYLDEQIAKIILSQTMTTDDGSSRAQAEVHSGVKLEVAKGYSDQLSESFNAGPARWLTAWNHPGAAPPRVWRDFQATEDLTAQAERDQTLSGIGYRPTEQRIREVYGDGYERVQQTDAQNPPDPIDLGEPGAEVVGPSDDVVEQAVAGDEWRRLVGPEIEALDRLVSEASTLEEVRDRLGEYAQRDPDAVTESLARVMFAAHVAGNVGTDIDGGD